FPDLESKAEEMYQQSRKLFAVCETEIKDGLISLRITPAELEIARGLERYVIIELKNSGKAPIAAGAIFGTEAPGKKSRVNIGFGETRAVLAPLKLEEKADAATLTVVAGKMESRLSVPVSVVEPAVLKGKIFDSDMNKTWPGRVYVKGSDNANRHAKKLAEIKTVSEKQILFVNKKYMLPFFYSDGRLLHQHGQECGRRQDHNDFRDRRRIAKRIRRDQHVCEMIEERTADEEMQEKLLVALMPLLLCGRQ
ncbi:hypothetical protein ACFL1X_14875, partial [Candidatus Hydrogenedentota bacterium]